MALNKDIATNNEEKTSESLEGAVGSDDLTQMTIAQMLQEDVRCTFLFIGKHFSVKNKVANSCHGVRVVHLKAL